MGLFNFFKSNKTDSMQMFNAQILPSRGSSYVVDENGEPLVVYYRENSKLFVNRAIGNESISYFLNIRRPLLVDVAGIAQVDLPPIPSECDGVILKGYGVYQSTAFIVRNFDTQVMSSPCNVTSL
ncbi:MAG: hypothetical protein R3Y61_01060 [Rikenellaceae bacterium]